MPSENNMPNDAATVPWLYGLARALVRVWFDLTGRKLRVLRGTPIPHAGPAILALGHPPSLLAALALVAASEQTPRCVLNLESGFWGRVLARWLGMFTCDPARDDEKAAVRAAADALSGGEVVAFFAETRTPLLGEETLSGRAVSDSAIQSSLLKSVPAGTAIYPCHLYLSGESEPSREILIYLGAPLVADDSVPAGGIQDRARGLARALDAALRQNVFRLMENDLRLFLSDLEKVLIEDLEEEWAARPDWKQKSDGFKLSQFLAGCVEQLNASHPARVVALRNNLETYREARRRLALSQAEVEGARSWLEPAGTRLWFWFESVVGLPVAFYGFANHLLAWAILRWRGLLDGKETEADPTALWVLRILVVVGCYAAQIAVCANWLGRAAAGYYALTLPFLGAYLWRYRWLVRARTRLLLVAARLPRGEEKLRELRKRLVSEINASRDAFAGMVGTPH